MAYTRITGTKNGGDALKYAIEGKGHNGNKVRNLLITDVNMIPPPDGLSPHELRKHYQEQMERFWAEASDRNKTQIRRCTISWSKNEFDPDNPEDVARAAQAARELVQEAYPNRQAVICMQADGKGGKLHAHCLISNTDMITAKGFTDREKWHEYLWDHAQEATARYTVVDPKTPEKTPDKPRNRTKSQAERVTGYSWTADLQSRVDLAKAVARNEADFLEALKRHGVEAVEQHSKKYGDYYRYELTDRTNDTEGKAPKRPLRLRGYNMGEGYGPEVWRQQEAERAAREAAAPAYNPSPAQKAPETAPEAPQRPRQPQAAPDTQAAAQAAQQASEAEKARKQRELENALKLGQEQRERDQAHQARQKQQGLGFGL